MGCSRVWGVVVCGRFALHHPNDEIHERFSIQRPSFLTDGPVVSGGGARYNIAPTQWIAVVDAERSLRQMRWGLVPRWSKDGKPFINARSETILEKPSFRGNFAARRIVVPCSGFYEWRTEGKAKVPLHIRMRSGELFGIGAIYEPGDIPSVALLTTAANEAIRTIHDRMPVIIPREDEDVWLRGTPEDAAALFRSYPANAFELFTVSTRVNGVRDDDAGLIEPERRGLFG